MRGDRGQYFGDFQAGVRGEEIDQAKLFDALCFDAGLPLFTLGTGRLR